MTWSLLLLNEGSHHARKIPTRAAIAHSELRSDPETGFATFHFAQVCAAMQHGLVLVLSVPAAVVVFVTSTKKPVAQVTFPHICAHVSALQQSVAVAALVV